MKWQPIETAPSNDFQGNVIVCGGAWPEPTMIKNDGDWWRYRLRENGRYCGIPTHWMHVPAKPDDVITAGEAESRGYCTDCENETIIHNGRCSCGSGRVIVGGRKENSHG